MEIKKYIPINKGSILGAFTVVISKWGNIEIDGIFYFSNGRKWINFASKEFKDANGEKKYYNQVRFPKDVQEKLVSAVFEKIKDKVPTQQNNLAEEELPF